MKRTNRMHARDLRAAADAVEKLDAARISVLGAYSNGRKPVLYVDQKPDFVRGVMIRRQPSATGFDRVMASGYHGVQLEWIEHVPFVREVGHA